MFLVGQELLANQLGPFSAEFLFLLPVATNPRSDGDETSLSVVPLSVLEAGPVSFIYWLIYLSR